MTTRDYATKRWPSGQHHFERGLAPLSPSSGQTFSALDAVSTVPPPLLPRDKSVLIRDFIYSTVATVFEIDPIILHQRTRGRGEAALARQAAMYLAHVACELTLTAVGRVFERDRSTVAHACRRIEDRREAVAFDEAIGIMERSVRAIVKTSPALQRDLALAERGRVSW